MKHIIMPLCLISVIGCGEKVENIVCDNHDQVHFEHKDTVTLAKVDYLSSGELTMKVLMPRNDASFGTLNSVSKVITVEGEQTCSFVSTDIIEKGNQWQASYSFDCGEENKLKKVSINFLENFSKVNEVEAMIKTPSSSKHFVLSRQCDGPIFNL